MDRRNWLDLSRKLVDRFDMDFSFNAIHDVLNQENLAFFGPGVLITTTYPNTFPITMSGTMLSGLVGNGFAFDLTGQMIEIVPTSPTPTTFAITPSHPTLARWDLLVIKYKQTGTILIPKPSDPLLSVDLNLLDDFELIVVPGVPSATPAYPAKPVGTVILAGLRVPAGATLGTSVMVDLSQREYASPNRVVRPVFKQEILGGAVDGVNTTFTLSQDPIDTDSILVMVDSRVLTKLEWSRLGLTITLGSAPAIGQDVRAYYVAAVPTSENPMSGFQEVPSGAVDGVNDVFALTIQPPDQASTLVFIDGMALDTSSWDLIQGLTLSQVKIHTAFIPAPGQSIYVFHLVNAFATGGGGGGGGGGSAFVAFGSSGAPIIINPVVGVPVSADAFQLRFVASSGGAQPVTANPQVAPGPTVGQLLVLRGTSATDYIQLADGNGLLLNGPINLTLGTAITLQWIGGVWAENGRT